MTISEQDAARIARRYPRRRTPSWLWIPLAVTFGALLVWWTVWAGWHGANPPVAAKVVGFKVVSDTQIDVQVTVQRADPSSRVACQVKALAISYETVGQLPFTWEPTGAELQTQWVTVRTFKRAVTGEIDYCRVVP
nr:DUF4307 domain-containing protein [Propionibacterium sp.]